MDEKQPLLKNENQVEEQPGIKFKQFLHPLSLCFIHSFLFYAQVLFHIQVRTQLCCELFFNLLLINSNNSFRIIIIRKKL